MKQPLPLIKEGRVLADWVTASLREAILNAYFMPGERLDQDLIARELDVSLTPVREAVRRLEAEGFIRVRPHYGAFVVTVSERDVREVYAVRRLLEPEVVRQIAPLMPEAVLEEIERRLEQAETQLGVGDAAEQVATDTYFEDTLLSYTDNAVLKDVLDALKMRIHLLRFLGHFQSPANLRDALSEHQAILAALRQRDGEAAAQLTALHLERSATRFQRMIAQQDQAKAA